MRKINEEGFKLIQNFESCVLHVYKDAVGLPTIGWGHLIKAGENFTTLTQEQADDLFRNDLSIYEQGVESAIKTPLTDNQFAACVSLAFNIGIGAFKGSSVCRLINEQRYKEAAGRFMAWNKANGRVLGGLTRRRKAEMTLFLKD